VGAWTLPPDEGVSFEGLIYQPSTGAEAGAQPENGRQIREELLLVEPVERQRLLEKYILNKIAMALKISPSRLNTQQPLNSLGLDSLTAVELKNWIEEELNVQVPITIFLQEPSIAEFSTQLLDQLTEGHINQQDAEQLLERIDQLSDEEVDALLSQISQQRDSQDNDGISQQDAGQLLAGLDQLSDGEVDALLSQMLEKETEE